MRSFDSNADGQFSADDEKFDQFRIWQDRNGDGRAGLGEMLSLEEAGVASIDLGGEAVNRNWAWGETSLSTAAPSPGRTVRPPASATLR